MQFVRDYLFTDIPNHLEFYQRVQNLGTDDDALLISLLERLSNIDDPLIATSPFSAHPSSFSSSASAIPDAGRRRSSSAGTATRYGSICAPTPPPPPPPPIAETSVSNNLFVDDDDDDRRTLFGRTVSHLPDVGSIKDPLRIAAGYAALRKLRDHQYNVYEYAYLISSAPPSSSDGSKQVGFMAIFAFVVQLTFFVVLSSYNVVDKRVSIDVNEDHFAEVVFIMIASSTMFGLTLSLQYVNAARFNSSMIFLRGGDVDNVREDGERRGVVVHAAAAARRNGRSPSTRIYARTLNRPGWYLAMNMFINLVVGVCIFVFNVYFVLTANDPTSAVWNSVALTFIIEIDEIFKPKWTESKVQCLLAELLMDYCLSRALLKRRDDDDDDDGYDWRRREDGVIVERRMGPSIDVLAVKFYVELFDGIWMSDDDDSEWMSDVHGTNVAGGISPTRGAPPTVDSERPADDDDGSFSVVVYSSSRDDRSSNATSRYDRTVYDVGGKWAGELHDAFTKFHCVRNFHSLNMDRHQVPDDGRLDRPDSLRHHHRAATTTTWFG